MEKEIGFGIIGCGAIGAKRADATSRVIGVFDIDSNKAKALSKKHNAKQYTSIVQMVQDTNIEAIIVATPNNQLAPCTKAAVEHGKHVLVEKPAGINVAELQIIADIASSNNTLIRIGFNHRYHPALQKAKQIIEGGNIGEIMFIRGRYGHGARKGYEKEWRANPLLSGGGELIDQGIHLIDLSRWFLGEFTKINGFTATYFWDMPVDDNAFISLRTEDGRAAWLQVSCTEWKNMFSYEIYGKTGKIQIDGLGGSYGTEKITLYKMTEAMGPPDTSSWEYPRGDMSWVEELNEFKQDILQQRNPSPNIVDAIQALKIVEAIYTKKE